MKTIALTRLNILAAPAGAGLSTTQKVKLLTELAEMGYRIINPTKLDAISEAFLLDYKHLFQALTIKRGGDKTHVPLFKDFASNRVNDVSYFAKRVYGYILNDANIISDSVMLSNGTAVPKWLFEVYNFGADPITQMQSEDLFNLAEDEEFVKQGDAHTEWIDLKLATDMEVAKALFKFYENIVYSKSSIKEELHADLLRLIDFFGTGNLDASRIVFKETKALLLKVLWNAQRYTEVAGLTYSAKDVLRMFAAVTDTDVSLVQPIKFPKMNRKARKVILGVLENAVNLAEDVKNYEGLWLQIGRYLHPTEYAKRYPKTAKVFDALRNGKIATFASVTEKLIAQQKAGALINHLQAKPGMLARKLHELLRKFPFESVDILRAFEQNAETLQLKNVLIMKSYFQTINTDTHRTVINKKGKIKVLENNAEKALTPVVVQKVMAVLDRIALRLLHNKETWDAKKVWIDQNLRNYTVPLQQRAASDGILTVGRGTRIDVDFDKVLRLFIYWKEASRRTDLDLSVMQMDADFKYVGHVSYTNLSSNGIMHSGDIQSAPLGAAEFVDITLTKLKSNVKHLAVQVLRYCGNAFEEMDCHAGWMMRSMVSPDVKTFDIKTVANKFDLNGKGSYAIPLVVDIANKQMVICDLFVNGKALHNNVEGSFENITLICSQIANFVKSKPTMLELASKNAIARNAWFVEEKEDADITIGLTADCTYNALDVEHVLAELI